MLNIRVFSKLYKKNAQKKKTTLTMYGKTQNIFQQFKMVNIKMQYKWTFPNCGLESKKKYAFKFEYLRILITFQKNVHFIQRKKICIAYPNNRKKYYLLMARKQTCLQIPIWSIFHENPDALPLSSIFFSKKTCLLIMDLFKLNIKII